jgi:hypothetical protein
MEFPMNRSTQLRPIFVAVLAAVGMSSTLTFAQPAQPAPGETGTPPANVDGGPATRPATPTESLEGTVKSMNVGPNGDYESLMLDTGNGRITQINFSPSIASVVSRDTAMGDRIELTAEPRRGVPDHAVYELVSITGKDGRTLAINRPGDEKPGHTEGTISSINYARDGRVNGVLLDNNTFVHVRPDAAEQLVFAPGQKVVADGIERVSFSGRSVIDADNVNGTPIAHPAPPKPGPHDGPREGGPKPHRDRDEQPAPPAPPAPPRG